MRMRLSNYAIVFLLIASAATSYAEEVHTRLANNIIVSAQYLPGTAQKQAVLVLHGFMTTRHFGTVQSIVNELSSNGYTVLAPTLSININDRKASVPCDAIHTSTLQNDVDEIAFWVDWLVSKGHKKITLIGHSMGSLQLVAYASGNPSKHVTQVIATSLVHTHRYTSSDIIQRELAMANRSREQVPPPVQSYHFVFCDSFISPPEVYLSYMAWSGERVVKALRSAKVPIEIVMGEKDRRFGPDWVRMLNDSGSKVTVIKGASHFFDATHEFDLLDSILTTLAEGSPS